jgi:ferredoxin
MKLKVDLDACTGHGRCYSLAPELFDADDYGHSVLLQPDVPDDQVDQARLAAANCPERAITIEE